MKKGSKNNVNEKVESSTFSTRFWEKVIQGLTITLVSALLMSASNQSVRLTTLESITMDKLEIVERLNTLEKNIDERLDIVESNQKVMIQILKELNK